VIEDMPKDQILNELGIKAVDFELVYKSLMAIIKANTNDVYRDICTKIYKTSEFGDLIKKAFGAKSVHHNYCGGLLEHTEEVCKICLGVLDIYPTLNRNLLIAGAVLHDIGKIYSYSDDGIIADYSFDGYMADHLYLGCEIVNSVIDSNIMARKDIVLLKHMILSHHGQRDWGSPVIPKIAEAQVLHMADNISAKVGIFENAKKENSNGKEFTDFIRTIDTSVYTGEIL
jgi:3'-5' exoribonuclease